MIIPLLLLTALIIAAVPAQSQMLSDRELGDLVRNYMEETRQKGDGAWPPTNMDSRLDKRKLVMLLKPYLNDANCNVRYGAVMRLGQYGDKDVVLIVATALKDPATQVREEAVDSLGSLRARLPRGDFDQYHRELVPLLLEMGRRVEASSAPAIRLLGKLGAVETIPDLKDLKQRIASTHNLEKMPALDYKIVRGACTAVLAGWGDREAREEIVARLRSPNVKDCVSAIRQAEYVGRDIGAELRPLLDDTRQTPGRSFRSDEIRVRVCDEALAAIVGIYGLKPSFSVVLGANTGPFDSAQIAEIKKLLEAELTKSP